MSPQFWWGANQRNNERASILVQVPCATVHLRLILLLKNAGRSAHGLLSYGKDGCPINRGLNFLSMDPITGMEREHTIPVIQQEQIDIFIYDKKISKKYDLYRT